MVWCSTYAKILRPIPERQTLLQINPSRTRRVIPLQLPLPVLTRFPANHGRIRAHPLPPLISPLPNAFPVRGLAFPYAPAPVVDPTARQQQWDFRIPVSAASSPLEALHSSQELLVLSPVYPLVGHMRYPPLSSRSSTPGWQVAKFINTLFSFSFSTFRSSFPAVALFVR